MSAYADALAAIDAAPITGAAYRTARRLLDRVGDNGMCWLTKPQMLALCNTASEYTMRRHLTDLRKANLIHYSINQRVYVGFLAWEVNGCASAQRIPQITDERMSTASGCKPTDERMGARGGEQNSRGDGQPGQFRASLAVPAAGINTRAAAQPVLARAQKPRTEAQAVAVADTNGHARGVCLSVCSDPDLSPSLEKSSEKQTNTQTNTAANTEPSAQPDEPASPQAAAGPNRSEEERSFALLTDPEVGLAGFRARLLAKEHSFQFLLTHVFCYLRDLKAGRVNSTGALVRRIDHDFGGAITDEDRETALWRRHVTVEEEAAWNAEDEAEQRHRKYDLSRFGLHSEEF